MCVTQKCLKRGEGTPFYVLSRHCDLKGRLSSLPILVKNRVGLLHPGLEIGMSVRRRYLLIIIDQNIKNPLINYA